MGHIVVSVLVLEVSFEFASQISSRHCANFCWCSGMNSAKKRDFALDSICHFVCSRVTLD